MQPIDTSSSTLRRAFTMFALVFAGEAVFFLPFVLPRVFRPTMLDLFGLTNFELGAAFSVYGIIAMLAYFPGGPLADLFSPRKLMVAALAATAIGGVVLYSIPGYTTLRMLYGYWGLTTILMFWAPLIRATREWAGKELPGIGFGLLDGGRGAVAALAGTVTVFIYAGLLPVDSQQATPEQRYDAFQNVILIFALITFSACVFVWFGLPRESKVAEAERSRFSLSRTLRVLGMPTVWLQAVVVVSAYAGYKGLDDVSLYANEVLGFDEVRSAKVGAVVLWVRPFAAVIAGLVADRWGVTRMTAVCFVVLLIASSMMASGAMQGGTFALFLMTIVTTSGALFALRGLYFAMMEEGRVPFGYTGTAVGIVSVIGYTPDVFMGPLMGVLLDRSPGPTGHYQVFAVVAAFAVIGLVATLVFWRLTAFKPRPT